MKRSRVEKQKRLQLEDTLKLALAKLLIYSSAYSLQLTRTNYSDPFTSTILTNPSNKTMFAIRRAPVSSFSCFCGRPGQCASPLPMRSAICRAVRPVSPFTVPKQGDVTDSQQSHQPGRSQRPPSSGM